MSLGRSKQRIADHGEVFTPAWMVEAMLDLVKDEAERIDSRFLEPACGSGNFLVQVLRRKLAAVELKFGRADFEKRHYALLALMCTYGIELLADNVAECRANMLEILAEYLDLDASDDLYRAASYVLSQNLVHGDALAMQTHDRRPITFAEWGYLGKGRFQRRDFRLDTLALSAFSKALKQAAADGLIPRNPAAPVKPPQPRGEEIRPLNREQIRVLFDAASGDRLEALYIVAVTAGLRRGELQGLKWDDLDLEAGMLQVRRTCSEPKGGHIFEAPKSGKGRNIRLTQSAVAALRVHRRRQLEERICKAGLWQEQGLIFPSSRHSNVRWQPQPRVQIRVKRAGLPQSTRFHDLRHTCATLLLRQGINPKFVQELLGHADISLTLNTYSHVLPDMGDAAAGGMEAALG